MRVICEPDEILALTSDFKVKSKSIGLVPTMGALHDGHLSLVRESVAKNDCTIVSIFVNPLQFNNEADLKAYPSDLEKDLQGLDKSRADVVFVPEIDKMYRSKPIVSIDFGEMATRLEGKYRPGHFKGVGLVVSKLFHLCKPDRAYFGLKDLQQYLLVRKMVDDLSFPLEIVGMPTVREYSGLAMSSRNERLSGNGKEIAASFYEGLKVAESYWKEGKGVDQTISAVIAFYNKVMGMELEYFHIVDPESLEDVRKNLSQPVAFCVAGYVEGIRLIDNLYLQQD